MKRLSYLSFLFLFLFLLSGCQHFQLPQEGIWKCDYPEITINFSEEPRGQNAGTYKKANGEIVKIIWASLESNIVIQDISAKRPDGAVEGDNFYFTGICKYEEEDLVCKIISSCVEGYAPGDLFIFHRVG